MTHSNSGPSDADRVSSTSPSLAPRSGGKVAPGSPPSLLYCGCLYADRYSTAAVVPPGQARRGTACRAPTGVVAAVLQLSLAISLADGDRAVHARVKRAVVGVGAGRVERL